MVSEQVGEDRPETSNGCTKDFCRVKGERGSGGQLEEDDTEHGKHLSEKAREC